MAVILSHGSALQALRLSGLGSSGLPAALCARFKAEKPSRRQSGAKDIPRGVSCVRIDRPTPAQVAALLGAVHPLAPADEPTSLFGPSLDLLCPTAADRSRIKGVRSHVWGRPLAPTAVVPVQEGLAVASAPACYVQLARSLKVHELALLGCELMGSYAPCGFAPFGLLSREPLMTPVSLRRFLDFCGSADGLERAREVSGYLLPHATSPMESRVALYLTLPRRLGGYGFPKPELNLRFDVDGTARAVADRQFYRGDLCWKDRGIALEYDSDAVHTGSDRIAADTKRRNALAYLGVIVVGITRQQALDAGEFDRVARTLAKLLGVSMRERRADQVERRLRLHESLFGRESFR